MKPGLLKLHFGHEKTRNDTNNAKKIAAPAAINFECFFVSAACPDKGGVTTNSPLIRAESP